MDVAADRLLANETSLTTLAKGLETLNSGNSALLELAQQASQQIGQSGGSLRDIDFTNQLAVLSQRIAKNANSLASSDEIDPEVAFLLGKDSGTFRDILNGLLKGSESLRLAPVRADDARVTLTELAKRFTSYESGVNAILANMPRLVVAKQAARGINIDAEPLLNQTTLLANEFEGGTAHKWTLGMAILFALLALLTMVLLGKVFLDDARVRAFESEGENKRNQEAILRLLNEMGNLADGDLTVQASVTEDVTGAIADSINFTIEELRTLVRGINSATDQVTKATQETQAISNRLYEASQRQNKEIQQASASVLQMAESINEVSQTATQSARVAQQSLAAAEKGGQVVQNQISGMNEIRTQIQDTSKRIKRLGESSMEIGEIVELISDITEQTNVAGAECRHSGGIGGRSGSRFHGGRGGSAAPGGTLGRSDQTDRGDREDHSGGYAGCRRGHGEVDGRRGGRYQTLRRGRSGTDGDPDSVARSGRPDFADFRADADAIGVGYRRDSRHAGHSQDHGGNDGRHQADQRVHRTADQARCRIALVGGGLQGLTVVAMARRSSERAATGCRSASSPAFRIRCAIRIDRGERRPASC